jgi:cell wall-associated NlpC family hydrolase
VIHGAWRSRTAVLAAALGLALPLGGTALADHRGGPSAGDVAAGRAAVHDREAQVRAAAAAVTRAQTALDRLTTAAEVAVERYNGARVREQQARAEVRVAEVVVNAASQRVGAARARVSRFGRAAYMGGGMSSVDVLLTSSGPSSLLYRLGTLEVISTSQRDAMQSLDAARVYQLAVEQQAQAALERAATASKAAATAKATAQGAVARQSGLVSGLQSRRHELAALLRDARQHASALEQARLAAIARAQAAAAAAAAAAEAAKKAPAPPPVAAPPPSSGGGGGGDINGTVSASTGQRAVQAAESQIGKPYEWGAAGPDTYDCSGLVMWAYAQVGVSLDHYTGYQWNEGAHIPTSSLRPGDLVFFATDTSDPNTIHHVGMYIGGGSMVEAPYTGANVRISPAFRSDLIGAVRPYNR